MKKLAHVLINKINSRTGIYLRRIKNKTDALWESI